MREIPGPEVAVIALPPAQPAPMIIPAAANSSSACTTAQLSLPSSSLLSLGIQLMIPSASDEDGVIGYHASS